MVISVLGPSQGLVSVEPGRLQSEEGSLLVPSAFQLQLSAALFPCIEVLTVGRVSRAVLGSGRLSLWLLSYRCFTIAEGGRNGGGGVAWTSEKDGLVSAA